MSKPPLSLSLSLSRTSNRFFLTYHRYTTSTLHPHHPRPQTTIHPPPHLHHPRRASTSSPPTPPTHYALFPNTLPHGPPPTGPFALDPRALRAEYLQLQRLYHPDTLHRPPPPPPTTSGSTDAPRSPSTHLAQVEGTSAHINDAYRTLLDPLQRAQYLLSLRGVAVGEADGAGGGGGEGELLARVMELREEIEGAESGEEIGRLAGENEERIGRCEGLLGEAFGKDDLVGARGVVVGLRYWVNVREALGRWEVGGEVVLVH